MSISKNVIGQLVSAFQLTELVLCLKWRISGCIWLFSFLIVPRVRLLSNLCHVVFGCTSCLFGCTSAVVKAPFHPAEHHSAPPWGFSCLVPCEPVLLTFLYFFCSTKRNREKGGGGGEKDGGGGYLIQERMDACVCVRERERE